MRYLKFLYILLFIALFVFGGFFVGNNKDNNNTSLKPIPTSFSVLRTGDNLAKVIKVVDGDTIKVLIKDKEETVRLIGIDTPEIRDPRIPVECFGRQASNRAKELLEEKIVKLESDNTQGDKDRYGRLLRYVFLEDGTSFNQLMIKEGFAHEYTFESNPYKYQKEFIQAEKEARENNLGLWSSCENK